MFNPFTVASVNEEAEEVTLVARQMAGPVTQALVRLASVYSPGTKVALNVDGPYGDTGIHLSKLTSSHFQRILFVAGGVGSAYIVPLYEHVVADNPAAQVQLVWAVRDLNEVTWATSSTGEPLHKDERVRVFLTATGKGVNSISGSDDVELNRLELDDKHEMDIKVESYERPDLQQIVDNVLGDGSDDRVAVIVCGPAQMARELRKATGYWVKEGKDAWFYNENYS